HFGEYELFLSLISLSPLPSAHPKTFQRLLVRTSIPCYRNFILAKGRSQSFASTPTDCAPCSDSLSLRLRVSIHLTSPVTVTRRLIMQKARRHHISWLRPHVSVWSQVLFHPVIPGAYHLSFTVLVHYLSLSSIYPYRMVPAISNGASPTPPYSGYYLSLKSSSYGPITLYGLVSHPVRLRFQFNYVVLLPLSSRNQTGLGSCAFARHYWRNHCCFLFLQVLRCFSSLGSPPDCSG